VVTIVKKGKVRNLTKTLAVVSLLAPASGHTLGIGEIKLHSALNQNLNAEIALSLSGESVSDIKVNLAPSEKFDEAGVAWTYFLSKIKFETITQSNGSAIIKLTSKEALKEPFLDFLLEVSWPKGSLYREFTVLVDPPSVYNPVTAVVPVSTRTEQHVQPTVASPSRQVPASGQNSGDEYGPTRASDTLWSVAERVRGQNDVSVEQMMIALYEANPHAFYKENVYALTAGKMLKIPEAEAVLKLSRNQALAEFNRHTHAWKNHSALAAHVEAVKEKPAVNQLTLIAPTKAVITDHAIVAPVSEQANIEKKAADVSDIVAGKSEGKAEPVDGAIQNKIAELEKQLAMMQELIALKDQQLAALQKQSQANSAIQEPSVPEQVEAAKSAIQVTPVSQPAEPMSSQAAAKPADQVTPAAQPAESIPNEAATTSPAIQASPAPQQTAVKPVQPVQPVALHEAGLSDPYYLSVGGAGSVILALIGWLWWRKRKVEEETNTESMFASSIMVKVPEADEKVPDPVVEDNAAHNVGTIGESSFLSEFTPSDFDSFDTDQGEIDPISEADVYLAYGRYQQAEELIRQAIKDQPNRDECKLKLLEVFYANENQDAFEAYANELAAAGKRSEVEFWEKAAEMGCEICPDSPLFSFGGEPFTVSENTSVESIGGNGGFNKKEDVAAGTVSFEESGSAGFVTEMTAPEGVGLDFDLISSKIEDDPLVDELTNNADIDFDLSSISMDSKESDELEKGVIAVTNDLANKSSGEQIESIDFDLSSFSLDSKEAGQVKEKDTAVSISGNKSVDEQIESIDFDLSSFSMDTHEFDNAKKEDASFSALVNEPAAFQVDDIDFDLSSFSMDTHELDNAEKGSVSFNALAETSPGFHTEDIDFDLGAFSIDTDNSNEVEEDRVASSISSEPIGAQIEDIDFDLSSFSVDSKESDEGGKDFTAPNILSRIPSEIPLGTKQLEFELQEFDLSPDKVAEEIEAIDFFVDKTLDFNDDFDGDFDFNFDLDLPLATSGQSNQYDEFGVSDLTDMDELETKLDLAKAYVDMGDADAAKDIAKEVLEQGTLEQKKTAQALLDELD
jgi:pilus assembly protein FimV